MLWEWRRTSVPEWQRILRESIDQGDTRREKYARWMLREILLDPDYQEEDQP
jgi:acyl-CoA reductase-like NAD-dependent aldehyde dehydrogenase